MKPAIHHLVKDLSEEFPTTQLPSSKYPSSAGPITFNKSKLGSKILYQEDFNYESIKSKPGKLRGKTTRGMLVSKTLTKEQLLTLIKTRYAFLLEKNDNGYTIDLSSLNTIKMRTRYHSLGCIINLNKDLSDLTITETSKDINPDEILQIVELALSIFSILKSIISDIYIAVTSKLSLASRVQTVANSVTTAANHVSADAGIIANTVANTTGTSSTGLANDISTISQTIGDSALLVSEATTLNTTQKTIYPFQHGTPQFLDRVDKLMLSENGLLYQLTGMDYHDMLAYIQEENKTPKLPYMTSDDTLDSLPLRKLGFEYWDNLRIFVEDCISKQTIKIDEAANFLKVFQFPPQWSTVDTLVYILWQQLFHHTLLVNANLEVWQSLGSYLTRDHMTSHKGTGKVIDAFKEFYSLHSTKLVSCADVLPAVLSRKFISLKEGTLNDNAKTITLSDGKIVPSKYHPFHKFKGFEFLNPDNVSITLV